MGGGTTVVEAMLAGRRAIGSDINELAVFVANVKVSSLSPVERNQVHRWATRTVPNIRYHLRSSSYESTARNMDIPSVRAIRKTITLALEALEHEIATTKARRFARCVLLNASQWALNGRRRIPTAAQFRSRVTATALDMLSGHDSLRRALGDGPLDKPLLRNNDAEVIARDRRILSRGPADLVVTSPPYPGVHMLYHRWQVDGRKETDAPYWISSTKDGSGSAYYNFADRREKSEDDYYAKAYRAFAAVRQVVRHDALVVQLLAFSSPKRQLPRYLQMLNDVGFEEIRPPSGRRTWRAIPGRRWHANSKGALPSSREVMLIHRAV
jgi:hypothetical protein